MESAKKTYARVYNWVTHKSVEIGGTKEQVLKDLEDMEKMGLVDEDCEIDFYEVDISIKK